MTCTPQDLPGWGDPTSGQDSADGRHPLRQVAPAVVGLCVGAGFALWRGRSVISFLLALTLVVLLAMISVRPSTADDLHRVVARIAHAVGVGLTFVLVGMVWLVFVVPVALFNRVVGIDLLDGRGAAGWKEARRARSGRRTYGREPQSGGSRGRRLVRFAVLVIGLVGVSSVVYDHATTVPAPSATPFGARSTREPAGTIHEDAWADFGDVTVSRHNFPGEPWGAEVLEFQGSAAPCGVPGADGVPTNFDVASTWTNVTDGRRRTLTTPGATETVWMFGGSTTYGIGQRDDHTIASDLVRLAAEDGRRIEVVNFGVCNELNWAETDRFERLLESVDPPDAAIFLDGVNDWGNGFVREEFGLLDASVPFTGYRTLEEQERLIADANARGYVESHDSERQVRLVSTQYRAGVERGRALARAHDIPVVHFWQPALFTTPPTAPGNPTVLANIDLDPTSSQASGRYYREAMEASGVEPIDLIDVFDDATRPVFFDCCHTNEFGAERQAQVMYPYVLRALDEAGAGSP